MANIQFDPDTYEKCKRTYDELQDGAFSKLQGAMSVVTEQAKESGVADLIKSCEEAEEEGVPALLKAFNSLMDVLGKYLDDDKQIYEALGNM